MKKIILKAFLIMLIIFSFARVRALEVGKIGIIVNRCVLNNDNKINIPVKVIGLNNGLLSSKILEYELGMIDNDTDLYSVSIQDVNGEYFRDILIDDKQNGDKKSKILFYLNKDINLKEMKEILNFNLVYNLKKSVDQINILGNTIYISDDSSLCDKMNEGSYIENKNMEQLEVTKESKTFNFAWIVVGVSFLINVILIIYIKTND